MPQPTDRTRLRRVHQRGSHDPQVIHTILDATPQCSVGYVIDGAPYVTPTLHWREGDHVYWHGSSASRALRSSRRAQVCLTVQILDGFVLARSGFHHSANFRAAMLFGEAFEVTDPDEKNARFEAFIDGLWPGRSEVIRPTTAQELKATMVLGLRIDEASAKIRTGGPVDDAPDYDLPIWAGVIPFAVQTGPLQPDPRNLEGVEPPAHVTDFRLGRGG